MRICYLDEDGRFGGPQQRMLLVAKGLKKNKKISIKFLIPKKDTDIFQNKLKINELSFDKINLTRLSLEPYIFLKYIIFFIYEIFLLYNKIKKDNFDLIQINSTSQFKGALVAFFLNKPSVWVIEDTNFNFIIKNIFYFLAKLANSNIVYTSREVDKYYEIKKRFKQKNTQIFAPVDLYEFNKNKKFKKNVFLDNKIIITSISGIIPIKGALNFVYLVREILKEFSNVCFVLTGQIISSQKRYSRKVIREIKKLPKNKFYLKGLVNNVPEILNSSDLFICTSKSEAGPITVLEAIAMDLPIISTNVGIVPQILKNNTNATILKKNNLNNLIYETKNFLNKNISNPRYFTYKKSLKQKFSHLNISGEYNEFYKKTYDNKNLKTISTFATNFIKFLRNFIAICCIGFVLNFMSSEDNFIKIFISLKINYLLYSILASLVLLVFYCKFFFSILSKITSLRTSFRNFRFIYFSSQLYNFIPFLGLFYRAIRLKKYKLSYSNYLYSYLFINWQFFITFLSFFIIEIIFFYFYFEENIFLNLLIINVSIFLIINIIVISFSKIFIKYNFSNLFKSHILNLSVFLNKNFNLINLKYFFKVSIIIHLLEFIIFYLISLCLNMNLELSQIIVFFIIITIIDFFPITPQNFGFSELSLALIMSNFGFSFTEGALLRLFVRLSNVISVIVLYYSMHLIKK